MIRSSSQYPEHLRVELEQRLLFGKGSDVIWRCGHKENGGKDMDTVARETRTQFNVHKFVLALNSKVFQVIILFLNLNTIERASFKANNRYYNCYK